ncbi:MAG: hypothetical protein L0H99_10830 [Loigolactobacillus coryniformis]|jgi:hypothetical protein|uniref:Uncharacterized protein n=2 Tax=Loigolactobacillus coryniformis TaxID=1610 RepID=A0A0R1F3W7_9LACO|nr:hypothetical protein [Loigolactobacillus coryniformis]MDT3391094.1 hypothetical protein [Bacillota bacterium]ATO54843.1 hypothetical protein LC20001_04065 [Loigolactobacillus coryniformis subsp. coryniformis KCTC 3167 = DSM 20001]KRK16517.1 hypothetical protein FD22_GL001232 [Loigolactobacillus coryniformis subsp. coryniformis KCTC 3167 = DSM 20001]MCL5458639.1 hypothetical protein [Loigolactobacillus coryniformis]MDN5951545.1 hypothetical protein [Loigolactobacillus coryniformis]
MLNRHNVLFIYLVFLGLQFVAIDSFCPNTPVGDSSIAIVGESDDGEAGSAGNKGKAGFVGRQGKSGHSTAVVQAAKKRTSEFKQQVASLEKKELSVKGLAMMIFGLEAIMTLPLVVFGVMSLNLEAKQARQRTQNKSKRTAVVRAYT